MAQTESESNRVRIITSECKPLEPLISKNSGAELFREKQKSFVKQLN